MISLIICSRSPKQLSEVAESIAATIGTPYELIAIDNSQGRYGICEAYNIGAAQSRYEVLCFMHEDVAFRTIGWGPIVLAALGQPGAGVLGVAGSTLQPQAPGGWTAAGAPYLGINLTHPTPAGQQAEYCNPAGRALVEAVSLDGLWLCCRKAVWQEVKFDAATFPGFHFYDVDFCVRVALKYRNYICFDIDLEHFSSGTFDKTWMQQALVFYRARKELLPLGGNTLTNAQKRAVSLKSMQVFTSLIIRNKLDRKDILYCLGACFQLSLFNKDNLYLAKLALR